MRTSDRICEEVKNLPEQLQVEVLDYVQFLVSKLERESTPGGHASKYLSLSLAMRGMEDEVGPDYGSCDLKERF
ncbi:MAG: hypothetical protein ABSG91_11875 [Syntrophobacteraceae bacterium]|jgi:hypothetical protein